MSDDSIATVEAPAAPGRSAELAGPVTAPERIVSLDVLRGFAVLGILVMNIQSFAMPFAAYMNPTAYGDFSGANAGVWFANHLLADQKFMTIFSMLFGAGVVIMASRRKSAGLGAASVHYRRMLWLLVFGAAHAYLLWYGDILFTYAVCGLLIYPLHRLRWGWLVALGLLAALLPSAISVLFGLSMPHWPPEAVADFRADWAPPPEVLAAEITAYRGGWLAQMDHRVPTALEFQALFTPMFVLWRAGGMMLLGMAVYKLGVLSATRSQRFYATLVGVAALVGLPAIAWGAYGNVQAGWPMETMFLGAQYNYWASILVALGWIGAVMLACRSRALKPVTAALAPVGRMALTCYLLETILCTTIFYGHGLGLFGRVERWQQVLIVVSVWAVLLVFAPLWLRAFRFGPFEWLWRSLTYLRLQPLRNPAARLAS